LRSPAIPKYSRGLQFLNCGCFMGQKKFHPFPFASSATAPSLCGRWLPLLSSPWLPASPPLYSMAMARPTAMEETHGLASPWPWSPTTMGPWPAVGHGGERWAATEEAKGKGMKFFCLKTWHDLGLSF